MGEVFHQKVDVTPCSNRQEETEAFKVVPLLCSNTGGAVSLQRFNYE